MKFSIFVALFVAGVSHVLATPTNITLFARTPECGVAGNAVTSDCEKLFSSNFTLKRKKNTCHYWDGAMLKRRKAYNPVCSPGNCCIYTTNNTLSVDQVREYGRKGLKACRSVEKVDRINGIVVVPDGGGLLCISNGGGCDDCFKVG